MGNKLNYSLLFSSRAEKDLKDSFIWYEDQQKGLGSRFIEEAWKCIHKIELNPELYSFKNKSFREAGLSTFPYVVVLPDKCEKKDHPNSDCISYSTKSSKEAYIKYLPTLPSLRKYLQTQKLFSS